MNFLMKLEDTMESIETIHQQALGCAMNFKRAEGALLDILLKIDDRKVFRELGYPSLFIYGVQALRLSEAQAYQFIGVARKSREVPELKTAIEQGALNVSTARRIVSVITPENKQTWLEKATTLPQKKLEMEIAKENPNPVVREKIKPVGEERLEMRLGITPALEVKLRQIKDLLSQKQGKACSIEDALEAMAENYLDKHDPVRRAKRSLSLRRVPAQETQGTNNGKRKPLAAGVKHQVVLRDQYQCAYEDQNGRCQQKRWLEVHHRRPLSHGGTDSVQNLITLCFHHHKKAHSDLAHPRTQSVSG
jgi:5-methylcytosine-specific restriction endonuclease McrA